LGFDDITPSSNFNPPPTTVEIPMYETEAETLRLPMGSSPREYFDNLANG